MNPNIFDDFDSEVQPEELIMEEDILDDNPTDGDFEPSDDSWGEFDESDFDEGSDRDNWEDEQVFQDNEW